MGALVYAADSERQTIDLMYRHGGSTSFKGESRLAEWWRDLHTVAQTVTLAPEWYPIGGASISASTPARGYVSRPAA